MEGETPPFRGFGGRRFSVHWEPSRRQTGCITGQNSEPVPDAETRCRTACGPRISKGHLGGPSLFRNEKRVSGTVVLNGSESAVPPLPFPVPGVAMSYPPLSLYINGKFLSGEGRKTQDVFNPATQQVIGALPHASKADLDLALASAQKAFETWRKSSPVERSNVLRKVAALCREPVSYTHLTLPTIYSV